MLFLGFQSKLGVSVYMGIKHANKESKTINLKAYGMGNQPMQNYIRNLDT